MGCTRCIAVYFVFQGDRISKGVLRLSLPASLQALAVAQRRGGAAAGVRVHLLAAALPVNRMSRRTVTLPELVFVLRRTTATARWIGWHVDTGATVKGAARRGCLRGRCG